MPILKPYYRTCRPFINGRYYDLYTIDSRFAKEPLHYIRAFEVIQKDLIELFDFIEPSDINKKCYSYRIHSLLLRVCVEFEANCKAILVENGYTRNGGKNWNIYDYMKIENSHHLSSYKVKVPYWIGKENIRQPFINFLSNKSPEWYQIYNNLKHDRQKNFHKANFNSIIDAFCGLLIILSSQFYTHDFSIGPDYICGPGNEEWENGIGGYFLVKFPKDWPDELKYDFNWKELQEIRNPFKKFDYTKIQK